MSDILEAGREMDALVAERVMGWGWMTRTNGDVLPFKRWLVPPEEFGDWGHVHPADLSLPMEEPWWLDAERCRVLPAGHTPVPAYSTDDGVALAALAKVDGVVLISRTRPDQWLVSLATADARGDTLALAISRVLLAVAHVTQRTAAAVEGGR